MTKILPRLYLSDSKESTNEKMLSGCKITHIVNVGSRVKSDEDIALYEKLGIEYRHYRNIEDTMDQDIITVAQEIKSNYYDYPSNKVLVHCDMGVSRSPAVVIYIKMRVLDVSYQTAYEQTLKDRPSIGPNWNFTEQLENLQTPCAYETTFEIQKYFSEEALQIMKNKPAYELTDLIQQTVNIFYTKKLKYLDVIELKFTNWPSKKWLFGSDDSLRTDMEDSEDDDSGSGCYRCGHPDGGACICYAR